jgi:hypothetical protein
MNWPADSPVADHPHQMKLKCRKKHDKNMIEPVKAEGFVHICKKVLNSITNVNMAKIWQISPKRSALT